MIEFGTDDNIVKGVSVGLTYVTPPMVWLTRVSEAADIYYNLISLSIMAFSLFLGFLWKLVDVRMKYNKNMDREYEKGRRDGMKEKRI